MLVCRRNDTADRGLRRTCRWTGAMLVWLGVIVGPSLLAMPAPAQDLEEPNDPGPIVTDRPTEGASPLLVPARLFQLELGYKLSRINKGEARTDTQLFPDLLARYGIKRKVEARLVAAGWSFQSGDEAGPDGFSDVSLGAKIHLADELGRRPQMALLVDVSLPVGHNEVSNDYVIPKVLFLGSNTLSDRLALTYNLGTTFVTAETEGGKETSTDLNYAVALSGSVGGPFSLFGELFGAFVFGSSLPDRHNFQFGTTILLNPRFQIDLRAGGGFVENEPDWLVGAGLAFRLPH